MLRRRDRSVRTASGVSVQAVFFAGYLAGFALLLGAIVAVGRALYKRGWVWDAGSAPDAAPSHHADRRQLARVVFPATMRAFALGAWAIAAYFRGRGGQLALCLSRSPFIRRRRCDPRS